MIETVGVLSFKTDVNRMSRYYYPEAFFFLNFCGSGGDL